MGVKKSAERKLCEDYCRQYPEEKDYTLAKRVWKENATMFRNIEHAREFVRTIRGHHGKKNRSELNKELYTSLNYDTKNSKRPFKEQINTSARVLILDIETAPIRAYVWGIWNQNVSLNQIQSDWFCLTWAAKWIFEDKVYHARLTAKEVVKQNDKRIIQGIWELINEADIVIAHNGEKFDMPKLNSRFIINGLHPPLPYQNIDTLKHIRRQFGFTSNKLDYVNKLLNLERKTDTGGFELWERCMTGDDEALKEMEMYNINDVRILEETYLHIRAWIKPHPNMGLFILDESQARCPSCGSDQLSDMGKMYYTTANAYETTRCNNCGASGRRRLGSVQIKQKRHLLLSTPK
jgi:DNA polymerase III epsilon subunit-like protein